MSQHAEDLRRASTRANGPGWPALVVTDPAGAVVHWGHAAEAVYGWTPAEAAGRTAADLTTVDRDPAESWDGPVEVRHRDGTTFVAHVQQTPVHDHDGRHVATVSLSYPVGEDRLPLLAAERGARTAAERATERLRRLQQVTAELSAAMTTEEVVDRVLRGGMELEGAGSGAMWLLDRATNVLRYAGAAGAMPGTDVAFAEIPLDADLPGPAVVRSGRAIYLTSRTDRDERWPALVGTPTAMEAQAIVPLLVDDRAIGCLSFGFPEERAFGAGERDFLAALANVCAQVLDRARLYEAERAASGRVAFLAEASQALNTTFEYEATLRRLVALLVERFAPTVAIDLVANDGRLERVATHGADLPPIGGGTAGSDVAMVVPLTARGRSLGVLYVARPSDAEPFTDDDHALAVDLAARAGSAVDNARLFAARTAVAETLQRSLLPPRLPDVPGLDLGARYRPAYAGIDVGGDFYDCFAVGAEWAFVIGDVVGSGPRAAAVTAVVRHTARAVAPYVTGPAAVVHAVREAIVAGGDDEMFCTLLYGSVARTAEGVRLSVVGAGHPPPYVVREDGTVERVPTVGGLLGAVPMHGIEPVEVLLRPGDALVGVTDGVLEARPARTWDGAPRAQVFFDEGRLLAVLERTVGKPAADVAGEIEAAVLDFTGGRAPDDVAVLVLRAT